MKILYRYMGREVLMGFLSVFIGLLLLYSVFDLIHELNDLGRGNYTLGRIFVFVVLAMPGHAYELLPIAALLGTLYGLSNLAIHSEMTVMRASGMSKRAMGLALLRVGMGLVALSFLIGEWVMPISESAAQQWRLSALNSLVATQFRSGLWVKDDQAFVNVEEMLPDATLRNLKIYTFDEQSHLKSIRFAARGDYAGKRNWTLSQVTETTFVGNEVQVKKIPKATWSSVLTPDILSVLLVEPEQMSLWNLFTYVDHLRENRQNTIRFEIAQWSKALYPFGIIVMMWLAVPFALFRPRASGGGRQIMLGVGLGLGFYLTTRLFSYMGQLNDWSPALSTLGPNAIFLGLVFLLGRWMEARA